MPKLLPPIGGSTNKRMELLNAIRKFMPRNIPNEAAAPLIGADAGMLAGYRKPTMKAKIRQRVVKELRKHGVVNAY